MDDLDDGLATPARVEALADRLSACADQLHTRLAREAAAIAAMPDGAARSRRRAQLEAVLDDEQQLRQRANRLYLDAATAVVAKLGKPQRDVIALADAPRKKSARSRCSATPPAWWRDCWRWRAAWPAGNPVPCWRRWTPSASRLLP